MTTRELETWDSIRGRYRTRRWNRLDASAYASSQLKRPTYRACGTSCLTCRKTSSPSLRAAAPLLLHNELFRGSSEAKVGFTPRSTHDHPLFQAPTLVVYGRDDLCADRPRVDLGSPPFRVKLVEVPGADTSSRAYLEPGSSSLWSLKVARIACSMPIDPVPDNGMGFRRLFR